MLQIGRRIRSSLMIATALLLLPTFAQAGVIVLPRGGQTMAQPDHGYGNIKFHPKQIILSISILKKTAARFTVHQRGNTQDKYHAVIGCTLQLPGKPRVRMTNNVGKITFPGEPLSLGTTFNCTVTVLGEGGVTGELPIYVTVGL